METVFTRYRELFQQRYGKVSSLNMGEDSIRYDFFLALQEMKVIHPWEIQLEHPLHLDSFVSNLHENSKRKEKPQVDLMIDTDTVKMCVEFAFFRRNSNPTGGIKVTENTFKMLNDFMRLALHSHHTKCASYFVCVADKKMLGYQLGDGSLGIFPAVQYVFDHTLLSVMVENYKSGKKEISDKFLNKLQELNITISANLKYNEVITTELNPLETRILIWEVVSAKK